MCRQQGMFVSIMSLTSHSFSIEKKIVLLRASWGEQTKPRGLMMFKFAGLILLSLCSLSWHSAAAQYHETAEVNKRYMIHSWETEDGLPQNSVISIAQSPDGYLWFGTFSGLVRFDGFKFTIFDPFSAQDFPSPATPFVYTDKKGRMWVSTDKGIGYLQNNLWHFYQRDKGWPAELAISFVEGRDDTLLISTSGKKILKFTGDRFVEIAFPRGSPVTSTVKCIVDAEGTIWAVGNRYLGRLHNSEWIEVFPSKEVESMRQFFNGLARGRQRGVWLTDSQKIYKYENGRWETRYDLGLNLQEPICLLEDTSGNLWAATWTRGVFLFTAKGERLRLTTSEGLQHDAIRCLFEDAEGNVWVGTDGGGVSRLKRRTFFAYDRRSGLPENIVNSVAEESPGRMVVGTYGGGVVRLENGRFGSPLVGLKRAGKLWVLSTIADRDGGIWVSVYGEGIFRIDGNNVQAASFPGYDTRDVRVLYQDSGKNIWLGGETGLASIRDGQTRVYGIEQGLPAVRGRAVVEDHSGNIWVGTRDDGIFKLSQGRFIPVKRNGDARWGMIRAFYADADGAVWIGTTGQGLSRWRDGKLTEYNAGQGFPIDDVMAILADDDGLFWLGTGQGIVRINRSDLNAVADGKNQRLQFQVFHKSDGLLTYGCNSGYQPTACKASDGRLWFAMTKGLAVVDPKQYKPSITPPPVWIEEAIIDHNPQPLDHTRTQPLRVPAGSRRIQIHYTGLDFVAPEKIRFAYQLEGLDADWVEVGAERVASFQDLRPGHYRFRVRAANHDGVWNETGDTLLIEVSPFFWQTWWARSFGILALIAGVSGVVWRVQENRLRRQREHLDHEKALAHERARSAALLEATSDLVCFADAGGRIFYLNEAGRHMLDLEPNGEAVELSFSDLYSPGASDFILNEGIPLAKVSGIWSGEATLRRRDGGEISVTQVILAHKHPDGALDFISTVARDITQQKRVAEQLRQSQKMEAIGRLAGGIAHDFNNLLTGINGYTELLLDSIKGADPLRNDIEEIKKAAERAAALTRQLLAFSRKQILSYSVVNMNAVVSGMEKMLSRLIGEDIELTTRLDHNLGCVKADLSQLEQVIVNLAVNARDAMPNGGALVIETANVELDVSYAASHPEVQPGSHVLLSVTDTGSGMDESVKARLFEPFFTTKEIGKGTGLGLATVYGIIKQSGGHLTVESELGRGSAFKIVLPRVHDEAHGVVSDSGIRPPLPGREVVLLVEDDQGVRNLICRILRRCGYTVIEASNGAEALLRCEQHRGPLHLLLSDVVMPQMSGRKLAESLIKLRPELKVLYMSGYTDDSIFRHGVLDEEIAFLQKPFTVESLARKVREVLDQ